MEGANSSQMAVNSIDPGNNLSGPQSFVRPELEQKNSKAKWFKSKHLQSKTVKFSFSGECLQNALFFSVPKRRLHVETKPKWTENMLFQKYSDSADGA